jgi:phosphoribosylglycinamide formyltransferase-1
MQACEASDFPARIVTVISNKANAGGLALAEKAGIATHVIDHKAYANREDFDAAMTATLQQHTVEIVCMAGFMRLVTPSFVNAWYDKLLNIHPSLLPAFKGTDTHARALAAGCTVAGCTVHLVRPEMDEGPILAQATVPILRNDTADSLSARVLTAEHRVYPEALRLVASGGFRVDGLRVIPTHGLVDTPPAVCVYPAV